MEINLYQVLAERTARQDQSQDRVTVAVLGLTGESGELANKYKKMLAHGHPFDPQALADELGDVLWYVAEIASALGITLDDVAVKNIAKLKARYPNGFSAEASLNRKE